MSEAFFVSLGVLAKIALLLRKWLRRHLEERLEWIEDIEDAWERRLNRLHAPIDLPGWSLAFVGGRGWVFRGHPSVDAIILDR